MRHVVIVGGGAALAQPLLINYLDAGERVTAVVRNTYPEVTHPSHCSDKRWAGRYDVVIDLNDVEEPIDVLVTLTGATRDAKLVNMDKWQWQDVIDACLTAPSQALSALLPKVKPCGNVVVVGSVIGSMGGYGCANYAAAKAGLVGLVRAAANEHAKRNVKVNLLELGFMDVGMGARLEPKVREAATASIPLRRFGTAEDFVRAVEFLATTDYCTGNILTLAGGLR